MSRSIKKGPFAAPELLKRVDELNKATKDAQTAQAAGTDFCAVLNGTTPAAAFAPYPSVHIAPDLPDLRRWLGL